ncbi:MAG: hypothetical protein GF383_01265 [Candidatus Lokiarchaeota archaeon]|nr:hypothetical protein [Candidatus Lokiarchaeota archaeon]MBD3337880.1 hypothetical protein [Candidatus Lokiarchaeota archaeon]
MTTEVNISWDYLKNISDTLESYRIRALIDAREEILKAGIYNEDDYYQILFKMFDEERLKYKLYDYINSHSQNDFDSLRVFARENNIGVNKAHSLLLLLNNEKLVVVEEKYKEKPSGEENSPPIKMIKDISFSRYKKSISEVKPIYEPVKVIFDAEICSGCGMCSGICPVNCITIENGFGTIDEDSCIRCGLCYFLCPRSYLPIRVLNMYQEEKEKASELKDYGNIGYFLDAYAAQTKIPEIREICQDGGIASTCLYYLLEKNKIDYALGARMSEDPWRPEPLLLKNKEDVLLASGTKYVNNPNLTLLNSKDLANKKIAVVGVPCQMQALLKSHIYDIGIPSVNSVLYRIGIFCMESFPYEEGFLKICEKLSVNVSDVKKTDINKGKFFIYTKSGEELNIPIKEISNLAREDCEVCFDLTSESADISVGSIGAPAGWNTVLIRTEKGKELFQNLIETDLIEHKPIKEVKPGLPLLQKIAGFKKKGAEKHISAKMENNEKFPIY